MIQTTEVSITYKGDGTQISFPFPYPYRSSEDVVGYLVSEEGYEEKITTNYTFDTVENTYTYPVAGDALTSSARIKLIRETPQQQTTQLPETLPFSLIEKELDWVMMILQEISSKTNGIWDVRQEWSEKMSLTAGYQEKAEQAAESAAESEKNASNSATAAATSATNAATSAASAKTYMEAAKAAADIVDEAGDSADSASSSSALSKAWAMADDSPDGQIDGDSSTGKTQSSRTWALLAKDKAEAAAASETNAKTSETNAAGSASAAAGSAESAASSASSAGSYATAAATSAASAKTYMEAAKAAVGTATGSQDPEEIQNGAVTKVEALYYVSDTEPTEDVKIWFDTSESLIKFKTSDGWAAFGAVYQ